MAVGGSQSVRLPANAWVRRLPSHPCPTTSHSPNTALFDHLSVRQGLAGGGNANLLWMFFKKTVSGEDLWKGNAVMGQ